MEAKKSELTHLRALKSKRVFVQFKQGRGETNLNPKTGWNFGRAWVVLRIDVLNFAFGSVRPSKIACKMASIFLSSNFSVKIFAADLVLARPG
jgi:hypothetical protein